MYSVIFSWYFEVVYLKTKVISSIELIFLDFHHKTKTSHNEKKKTFFCDYKALGYYSQSHKICNTKSILILFTVLKELHIKKKFFRFFF